MGVFGRLFVKPNGLMTYPCLFSPFQVLLSDIVKHFPNINFWKVNQIQWDIAFYRALRDWEHGLMEDFLNLIHSSNIQRDEEDIICWMPTKGKLFEVKSFYRVLRGVGVVNFPWKSLQGKSPFESSFFCLVCCFREDFTKARHYCSRLMLHE